MLSGHQLFLWVFNTSAEFSGLCSECWRKSWRPSEVTGIFLYPVPSLVFPCFFEVSKFICVILLCLEIAYLRLVKLDISGNRISTLPVELRTMTTLVDLNLSHNPLTSPPSYVSETYLFVIYILNFLPLLHCFVEPFLHVVV